MNFRLNLDFVNTEMILRELNINVCVTWLVGHRDAFTPCRAYCRCIENMKTNNKHKREYPGPTL